MHIKKYDKRIIGSAADQKVWELLTKNDKPFDVITSVGLPAEVLDLLLVNSHIPSLLTESGVASFFTDMPVYQPKNSIWELFHGRLIVDSNIFVHKKA